MKPLELEPLKFLEPEPVKYLELEPLKSLEPEITILTDDGDVQSLKYI